MSRTQHEGRPLEDYLAPISHRFLIPVFFVALGLEINWRMLFDQTGLLGIGAAFIMLGAREVMHGRWRKTGGDRRAFLLLCPNLTIVALAAKSMLDHGTDPNLAAWLMLTGLFITVPDILLLPSTSHASGDNPGPHGEAIISALPASQPGAVHRRVVV